MALNPFFLQGSPGEQRLIQDLINEQLKIYGIEVSYIPRKFVRKQTIIEEIQSSRFDDNFALEAYVNTYDGYGGAGDILTKFGMSLRDELIVTISKERFEDFITPFLSGSDADEIVLATRPREGDLIYFPLGERLFEVKFVEHEQPFYQLGKTYVYELKCELFEYEDEVINTTIEEIDTQIEEEGYITTLKLVGIGATASVTALVDTGYIDQIYLNNDGSGYTSQPVVSISTSPRNNSAYDAKAVAITTNRGGVYSIESLILTNAGAGYTVAPIITISGGGGTGAAATCSVRNSPNSGVVRFIINDGGTGYTTNPVVTIASPASIGPGVGVTAVGISSTKNNILQSIYISNPGYGYTSSPVVTIAAPPVITGIGTYLFNEIVVGSRSNLQARVKHWDVDTKILKVSFVGVAKTTPTFYPGEIIVGSSSSARYSVQSYEEMDLYDKYSENDEIEAAADLILDFSESNPFGSY